MLSWFVDIFDAPTVEDMVFLTITQRSGKDSPRFMGINSRRRSSLCPLDVNSNRAQMSQMGKHRSFRDSFSAQAFRGWVPV